MSEEFKVNYFSGFEEAQKTKDVKVDVLFEGFDQKVNCFGLASYASKTVIVTGGFSEKEG